MKRIDDNFIACRLEISFREGKDNRALITLYDTTYQHLFVCDNDIEKELETVSGLVDALRNRKKKIRISNTSSYSACSRGFHYDKSLFQIAASGEKIQYFRISKELFDKLSRQHPVFQDSEFKKFISFLSDKGMDVIFRGCDGGYIETNNFFDIIDGKTVYFLDDLESLYRSDVVFSNKETFEAYFNTVSRHRFMFLNEIARSFTDNTKVLDPMVQMEATMEYLEMPELSWEEAESLCEAMSSDRDSFSLYFDMLCQVNWFKSYEKIAMITSRLYSYFYSRVDLRTEQRKMFNSLFMQGSVEYTAYEKRNNMHESILDCYMYKRIKQTCESFGKGISDEFYDRYLREMIERKIMHDLNVDNKLKEKFKSEHNWTNKLLDLQNN